jgi:hypothetical protein
VRKNNTVDFIDRFKGKLSKMTKEGHIGVAKTTNAPIEKNSAIIIDQQTLNSTPQRVPYDNNIYQNQNLN